MKTFYKFILDKNIIGKPQYVEIYEGALILSIQNQNRHITGWMWCDTSKPKQKQRFVLESTGHPSSYDRDRDCYQGTVQIEDLVYHVIQKDVFMDY
jgi:hypothetical protein